MFRWLKGRLQREHRKLAWQNFKAAHDPEMRTLSGLHGDWDAFDGYDGAKTFAEYFIQQMSAGNDLSTEEIDAALKLNRGLRANFDAYGRQARGTFDMLYAPREGWKDYFKRNDNEKPLVERQKMVDSEVARMQREFPPS